MNWPQWVLVLLLLAQVVVGFLMDGRPRSPWSFSDSLLGAAVMALLLHAGGFWK